MAETFLATLLSIKLFEPLCTDVQEIDFGGQLTNIGFGEALRA